MSSTHDELVPAGRPSPAGAPAVRLEVWSDVQCSWCPIGARRLGAAVAAFGGAVEVVHRTFALAPDAPEDFDAGEHTLSQHGITEAQRQQALAAVTTAAAGEGLDYRWATVKPTNSRSAHRLLHHAATLGARDALWERLTRAYFLEGRHIGRIDELVRLSADAGLDADAARQVLLSDRHGPAVDADRAAAEALGVSGVPFTVVDGRWGISGAQAADVYLDTLRRSARPA